MSGISNDGSGSRKKKKVGGNRLYIGKPDGLIGGGRGGPVVGGGGGGGGSGGGGGGNGGGGGDGGGGDCICGCGSGHTTATGLLVSS